MRPLLYIGGPLDGKKLQTPSMSVEVVRHPGKYTREAFRFTREFFDHDTQERTKLEIWIGRVMVWNFLDEKADLTYIIPKLDREDFEVRIIEGDELRLYSEAP